jgi:Fic family protein
VPVGIYSGGNLVRQCPNPFELNAMMYRFLFMVGCSLESSVFAEREKMAKECHIKFEEIHPFEDGNGRVGRLIWAWQRRQMGLPLLIIFNREKQEYYKLFN